MVLALTNQEVRRILSRTLHQHLPYIIYDPHTTYKPAHRQPLTVLYGMPVHQFPRIPSRIPGALHEIRKRVLRVVVFVEDFPAAPGTGDEGDVVVVCVLGAEKGDAGGTAD